ncbi:MAG: flagellin [Gammaproteobacteria bacterium]
MALVVNTNVSSLNAQRNLAGTTNGLSTAMERLSSGQRINSAADDAAGLAISTRMTSQVRGLTQAVRNANDGISIVQTAEGALQEVTDMLQRMRELAVQSASGASSDADRSSSNDEVAQLLAEIDRVAGTTRFNNMTILDGSYAVDLQIGDQADQTLAFGISNMATSAMGESATGLGEAAASAVVSTAGSANAADYVGRSLTIGDESASATVTLSTNPTVEAIAATVSGTVSGEDYGPATSRVLGTIAFESNTLDLTADAARVFGIRVKDGNFLDIDLTDHLIAALGYDSEAQLEDTTNYYGDEVSKADFLTAAQAALDDKLTGAYAVTVSVGADGEIKFTDVDGREDTIALRAGAANAAAGTFISSYVHAEITTNATMTNIIGQGGASSTTADFSSTDNLSVFKAAVNGGTATTVDFLDKLNDTSIVKDRSQMFVYELVDAIQAELDEVFSGDDAVTVGFDYNKGLLTFSVAGGARTITLTEGTYSNSAGTATASTFVNDLIDDDATATLDNKATGLAMNTAAVALDDITTEFKYDHYGINVRVNGGTRTDIDLALYLQAAVADQTDVAGEEVVAALQAAFDDNFTGDDAVTVSLDENGRLNFDVAGGAQVLQIQEADFNNDGTYGTFGVTFIESTISGATTAFEVNENLLAETVYGNIEYGSYSAESSGTTANSRTILASSLSGFEGGSSEWGDGAQTGNRMRAFAADDLNSGKSSTTAETTTTAGLTVAAANDAVGISIDDATAITVTVDAGEYSTLEAYAAALQYEIDAHGSFGGENAINVGVEYYTNATSGTTAKDGQLARLVMSSDYGKKIELSGQVTVTATNGFAFFGAETDTVIANTALFDELGIDPATTSYRTHDRVDGGIDTTVDSGVVTLAVTVGGNTYSYGLALSQDANTSFDDFVSDLQAKANAAFAAQGISFTGSNTNGAISFAMDDAGDATMSLSGTIVQNAFGSNLSGTGVDAGIASMSDVVSAINSDLSDAGVGVTSAYDEATGNWSFSSSSTGAAAAVSVAGSDLAQLGMTAGSANGVDATATAAVLSSISVSSASDALSALDSIDNAIEYISSQRGELGAIENRLNHTVNNLSNVVENTAASRSRILDADYAVEAANLAKLQVMQQAGSAMLAQANAQSQLVLSLLG